MVVNLSIAVHVLPFLRVNFALLISADSFVFIFYSCLFQVVDGKKVNSKDFIVFKMLHKEEETSRSINQRIFDQIAVNERTSHSSFQNFANGDEKTDQDFPLLRSSAVWSGSVSLFNDISTFAGYLMPKHFRRIVMLLFDS